MARACLRQLGPRSHSTRQVRDRVCPDAPWDEQTERVTAYCSLSMLDSAAHMSEFPHLSNAPVTEAVIDFRVEPVAALGVDGLTKSVAERGYLDYVHKGYVIRSEFGFSVNIQADPKVAHGGRAANLGLRLHSQDDKYVAQLRIDGFTLSRLAPYESWENLFQEARRLWAGYRECVGLLSITRTATRYINNLRLPVTEPLERFLKLVPSLPQGLPQGLSGFLQRYVLSEASLEATVILTQALEVLTLDKPLPVILDIDAFLQTRYSGDDVGVWDALSRLRTLKNRVFFGCLTTEGVDLYR